jgi:hypothetical protein
VSDQRLNQAKTASPSQAQPTGSPFQTRPFTESEQPPETAPSPSHSFGDITPAPPIQAKLTIGQPGDPYEQEADRIADQVMAMPDTEQPQVQRMQMPEEEELQMKPVGETIQRMQMPEEEEELQMKADTPSATEAGSNLESQLNQSKSGGEALDESARSFIEPRMGFDFGHVRVHTDSSAVQMNQQLGARAFTHGSDIYFGSGQYNPSSTEGRRLLTHELTHVVQQSSNRVSRKAAPSHQLEEMPDYAAPVSMQLGTPASIQCDGPNRGQDMEEIIIRDESLPASVERDSAAAERRWGGQFSFGSSSITNHEGGLNESNPLVRNARARGGERAVDELQGLAEDFSNIRPLYLAWVRANTGVNSIAIREGIDPGSPQTYRPILQRFGNEARSTSLPHTEEIRRNFLNHSGDQLRSVTSSLSAAFTNLRSFKTALERQRNSLRRAALSRSLQEEQSKLAKVRETIETITQVITTTASLISTVSAALAATNAALSGAELDPAETFGSVAGSAAVRYGGAGRVGQVASTAASGGNIISKVLEYTIFYERIQSIQSTINRINRDIQALEIRDVELQTTEVLTNLETAANEYRAAETNAANVRQNLFQAFSLAGRKFDQHLRNGRPVPGAENVQGATSRPGEEYSMEAILALIAQLQIRGSARNIFATVLNNSQYIRRAEAIKDVTLEGSRSGLVPLADGARVIARPDIDVSIPEEGFNPSLGTQLAGFSLRQTVALCNQVIEVFDREHQTQTDQENAWQAMLREATSGLAH